MMYQDYDDYGSDQSSRMEAGYETIDEEESFAQHIADEEDRVEN